MDEPGRDRSHDRRREASVIIPAHNAEDVIGDQLDALARQDADFEVVVVLNRCTDGTAEVVEGFADRLDVRTIIADDVASAGYARNVGAHHARTSVLLFCDADDQVGSHWVSGLRAALDRADFVGGRLEIDVTGLRRWRRPVTDPESPPHGGLHLWDARLLYPITASFGCRRTAFEEVGGFDEGFRRATSEDVDLALRLFRAGKRMAFAPDAVLRYRPRSELRELLRQRRSYADGDAILAAKEGWMVPASWSRAVVQMSWAIVWTMVHHRTLSPRRLWVAGAKVYYRSRSWRRLGASGQLPVQDPDAVVDFVVPLSDAIVGGLAFAERRSNARSYFRQRPDADVLDVISSVLAPGGTMLDLEPRAGVAAVAAGMKVGAAGEVVCYESSGPRAQLTRSNLARHGFGHIARVVERLDPAEDLPERVDLVRLDETLCALGSIDDYRRLIESLPDARFLVPLRVLQHEPTHGVVQTLVSPRWHVTEVGGGDVVTPRSGGRPSRALARRPVSDGYAVARRRQSGE